MSMLKSSIKPGVMVRVDTDATEATKAYAEKHGVTSLIGKCLTGVDPCCGCVIVEFKVNIGTTETFYSKGKLGHVDEVNPEYLTKSKSKGFSLDATPSISREPRIGDRVQVVESFDAAKAGMKGKVITRSSFNGNLGIEFDTLTAAKGGHSLSGALKGTSRNGKGQWVPAAHVKVIAEGPAPEAAPVDFKLEFLKSAPIGATKVYFGTTERKTLNSGRTVSPSGSYYGWLVKVVDGYDQERSAIIAPFGGDEWLTVTVKDEKVENIRKA